MQRPAVGFFSLSRAAGRRLLPAGLTCCGTQAGPGWKGTARSIGRRDARDRQTVTEPTCSERREVYFSGRVQGVGFRYTVERLAARYDVRGFVQNLRDGRVFLVVESRSEEIDRFLGAIHSAMDRYIADVQTTAKEAREEFEGFTIRF